jgi:exopolysaccharide biosynthesis WecB/TagA/CpsF family protein
VLSGVQASTLLADRLAEQWATGGVVSVTWLNHHGALRWLDSGMATLAWMDYVGVDGLLLTKLLGYSSHERTSADLVLPRLLPLLEGARIALIGTRRPSLDKAAAAFRQRFAIPSTASIVDTRDGYSELAISGGISSWLEACQPNVIVVGLGSGLQERWALEVAARLRSGLLITCGGYLDQVHQPAYYPSWAYSLRLNWAMRLARDPTRLWRRYTTEAVRAIRRRPDLSTEIRELAGFKNYLTAIVPGPPSGTLFDPTAGPPPSEP